MSSKTYLIILKSGVFFSLIAPLLVFKSLLFPFITSKQIFFNVLVEILFVFWLAFVIKYPAWRPKLTYVAYGLISFFAVALISSLVSVDFNLSFWGDVERMLGVFHVLHFLVFYFIIITVFRNWRDWRNFFIASLAVAMVISFFSLFKIHYSTIGNTAYVSGYMIFNIFFALVLLWRGRRGEHKIEASWLVNIWYIIAIIIMLVVMAATRTRGAYVGLAVSFFLMFLLLAWFSQARKVKFYFLSAVAVIVIFFALIFIYPESRLVRNNSVLGTIAQISSQAVTFQTRMISWKAAWRDFPEHPILGTGYGNFAIIFDKYFDPKFYNYTTSETYFDRAHNNLVDLASTTGMLGLAAYLSIFAAAFYYLTSGLKKSKIAKSEFVLLFSLIIAYFIQNLAVFDSLVTYLGLMMTLGFIYWLWHQDEVIEHEEAKVISNKEISALLVIGLIMLMIIYQFNVKVWRMLNGTIAGQMALAKGDAVGAVLTYQKALGLATVLDRDSRSSLINALSSGGGYSILNQLDKNKAKEVLDYVIKLAEENVKYNPLDSMMQMQLALILNTASTFHADKTDEFYFYSDRALEAINKSIAASPGRITIYLSKAQVYLMRNDKDKAIETISYAVNLNDQYADSQCQLAKMQLYYKNETDGYKAMDKCLDLGGAGSLNPPDLVKMAINYYTVKNDTPRLILLYNRWLSIESSNAKVYVILAKMYADQGRVAEAIAAAQKAGEIDPALKDGAESFIKGLR